jgi:RHS repeat-associated protein
MYDAAGQEVWSATIDVYGDLREVQGDRQACPFRWPGQYEDAETGLYYNRFRYYDPEAGEYTSRDPLGFLGGPRPHAYVSDPLTLIDPLGLACTTPEEEERQKLAYSFYREAGFTASRAWSHMKGIDLSRPVERTTIPAGATLAQHVLNGKIGNYFSEPGISPTNLGINPASRVETPMTSTREVSALKSTAAPINDTWTTPGSPFQTSGGAIQLFVPDNGGFVP